jgi:hypothetical protein
MSIGYELSEITDKGGNEGSREAFPLAMLESCASAYHLALN